MTQILASYHLPVRNYVCVKNLSKMPAIDSSPGVYFYHALMWLTHGSFTKAEDSGACR